RLVEVALEPPPLHVLGNKLRRIRGDRKMGYGIEARSAEENEIYRRDDSRIIDRDAHQPGNEFVLQFRLLASASAPASCQSGQLPLRTRSSGKASIAPLMWRIAGTRDLLPDGAGRAL